jgi:UDP-N-acetyl-D-galactosamine dehydrogenase
MKKNKIKVAIIGLGYVGLPLAIEFAKKRTVIGFDTKKKRIEELKKGVDKNLEISRKELKNSKKLIFTSNTEDLKLIKPNSLK